MSLESNLMLIDPLKCSALVQGYLTIRIIIFLSLFLSRD